MMPSQHLYSHCSSEELGLPTVSLGSGKLKIALCKTSYIQSLTHTVTLLSLRKQTKLKYNILLSVGLGAVESNDTSGSKQVTHRA